MTTEPPLGSNRWHHGNGVLVCGSVRIATMDFDTNPSEEFQKQMFDWICATLNKAASEYKFEDDYGKSCVEPQKFANASVETGQSCCR